MNRTSSYRDEELVATKTVGQNTVQLCAARPVQWQSVATQGFIGAHDHEFSEIVLVKRGAIAHQSGAQLEKLLQGDVLVIPPGPIHAYGAAQACELVNVYFLSEWFLWDLNLLWRESLVPLFFAAQLFRRAEMRRIWRFQLRAEELAACERELDDIACQYRQAQPSLLFIRGAFSKFLVILASAWQRQTPHIGLDFRPEVWRALESIDRRIKQGESFQISAFAREEGLATGSFSRLFRAATGLAPSQYFSRRRTQHAAHLLLESQLSIGEIAQRLGFCDASHLARAFLENRKMAPRAFRARYRRTEPDVACGP